MSSKSTFRRDAIEGLRQQAKTLPCKYFYDRRGSELFEQITELDAYYLTRTELGIMKEHAATMADRIGPRALLIEYGSGSSRKTRILLDELEDPRGSVPVDISAEHLQASVERLVADYADLEIFPITADYTRPQQLPIPAWDARRTVVYFPGSTLGNFETAEAIDFLAATAKLCGPGGGALIGTDLVKDPDILIRAYDDPQGITAAFNLNVLHRANRELQANFDLQAFTHEARWNAELARIEMGLISRTKQTVTMAGESFDFSAGERIHTESCHKYTLEGFPDLARRGGFTVQQQWTDPDTFFCVWSLLA